MTARKSSNMKRLRKGDRFIDPVRGDVVTCNSSMICFADRAKNLVAVPVIADGATKSSRRKHDADTRVMLLV